MTSIPPIRGKVTVLPQNRTALDFSEVTAFGGGILGWNPIGEPFSAVGPDGTFSRSADLHPETITFLRARCSGVRCGRMEC